MTVEQLEHVGEMHFLQSIIAYMFNRKISIRRLAAGQCILHKVVYQLTKLDGVWVKALGPSTPVL